MTLQTFTYRIKSTYSFNEKTNAIFGIQGMTQNNKNGGAPEHVLPNASLNDISLYGLVQYHAGSIAIIEAGLRYSFRKIDVPLQPSSGDPDSEPIDPRIQEIQESVEELLGVKVSYHSLTFYGKCGTHDKKITVKVDGK